jgi:ribosomal protein S18 acetylase RimI-like enzyme
MMQILFLAALFFLQLAAHIAITPFDYNKHGRAVTALIQADWSKLFMLSAYEPHIVNQMLAYHKPGDYYNQDKHLYIHVMQENGHVAGFITYYYVMPTTVHVELLVIDKQYRSKGLGKELMNFVMQHAGKKGAKNIELYVYTSNPKAIEFYHRLGFITKFQYNGYLLLDKKI